MQDPIHIERYLQETLQQPVRLEPWARRVELPAYLRQYDYRRAVIEDTPLLFVVAEDDLLPSTAAKHLHALLEYWHDPIAFALARTTPRARQRYVNERIPFVVPGSQVYLPMLATNLTERYKRQAPQKERLRPSAQVLLLHLLLQATNEEHTPGNVAKSLGYTAAAIGQAVDQLVGTGLATARKDGRRRPFRLDGKKRDVWAEAQPFLATPVQNERLLFADPEEVDDMYMAGLSALARYSMISEPRRRVFALPQQLANRVATSHFDAMPDEASSVVEVWTYAPSTLSRGPLVDRLSLYLSLRDDPDERVQGALEEMMEEFEW